MSSFNPYQGNNQRSRRVKGDNVLFFGIQTIFSMLLFVIMFYSFDLRTIQAMSIKSFDYWRMVGVIIMIYIGSGVVGRVSAYFILRIIYKHKNLKEIKRPLEYNKGMSRMSIAWLIAIIISAFLLSWGALEFIQQAFFGENTFWTLVGAYFILKVGVFILTRIFTGWKL